MRILFFGSGDFAVPALRSMAADGHTIVAAVTQPDRPRGRGKTPMPTPLKAAAQAIGIETISPENVNADEVVDRLMAMNADFAFVAAFGQMIRQRLLTGFPAGIVNLHGSLLPALRGAAPIQWSVINGDPLTGVTIFRLVEKMDAGPILCMKSTEIGSRETASELHDRLAVLGCDAARETLSMVEQDPTIPGTPQNADEVTFAPKLKKSDGHIKFDQRAETLASRIRGLWSWPGATCRYVAADGSRNETISLARAIKAEGGRGGLPGEISEDLTIHTGNGELRLLEVKPAGKRLMPWTDFTNGRHVKAGDRLVPVEATR